MRNSLRAGILSGLMLLATGCATTGTSDTAPVATLERVTGEGPALWKVSDADTTIYLFGTIHILPKDVQWRNARIEGALASSDAIVTELMPGADKDPAFQQLTLQRGTLPQGQTLRGLMNAEQRATYEAAMAKAGLPVAAFDQFKPWMAGLTLSIIPLMKQGYDLESGVEKTLETMAGPNKQRAALETPEFQINVFDSMPQQAQLDFLLKAAADVDDVKAMVDSMVARWRVGDADGLAKIMNEGMDDPLIAEKLLFERNRTWAGWIDKRLDQPGTVFIAVGAGHLAGENSVQDYLVDTGVARSR